MSWQSVLLDLSVVVVFLLCLAHGIRRGLIRSVIGLVGSLAALVIAILFSSALGSVIDARWVNEPVREWISDAVSAESAPGTEGSLDLDAALAENPQALERICSVLGLDQAAVSAEYETLKQKGTETAQKAILSYLADPFSAAVSRVIAFVVLYLAAFLAILLLSLVSKIVTKLPVIRQADRLGGAVIGILTGVVLSFVFVTAVSVFSGYLFRNQTETERTEIREHTVVYKRLYELNPLDRLFQPRRK